MSLRKEILTNWIPLDDMDFLWNLRDVQKVIDAYRNKIHIAQISKIVKRPQDEVAILIMDLGRKEMI